MSRQKNHSKRIIFFWVVARQNATARLRFLLRRKTFTLFGLLVAFYFIVSLIYKPSYVKQETFSAAESTVGLPPLCINVAARLNQCQHSSPSATVVFACHQTWCNGWGHCGLCSGIGDRSRNLMSLVQDAFDRCVSFEIDASQTGLAMREDFVYHDRWGILSEWFHFRSYDVTDRRVNINEWSHHHHINQANKNNHHGRTTNPIFVHMTPDNYAPRAYDPCLFHILFRPSHSIQRHLDSFLSTMSAQNNLNNPNNQNNMIGIHLRSGDIPAFGLTDYKDSRVSDVKLAVDKMIHCGQSLAKRLFADSTTKPSFFFATDHLEAKELAKRKVSNYFTIFTTDIIPLNYQRHEGDAHAWLEVWILSKMVGLVTNVLPKGYSGTAGNFSYFALLAANVGFMNSTQLFPCQLPEASLESPALGRIRNSERQS